MKLILNKKATKDYIVPFKECSKKEKEILKKLDFNSEENSFEILVENSSIKVIYSLKKEYELEDIRILFSKILRKIKDVNEDNFTLENPFKKENEVKALVEAIELCKYKFRKYFSEEKEKKHLNLNLIIEEEFLPIIKETQIICNNVNFTRNLVNESAYVMTPKKIEELAKEFAKKNKLKIKVLNEKQLDKEGLHLHLAVGKGSVNPPRLVIVEYKGNKKSKSYKTLLGKGITFDTGGANLKPTGSMEDMRIDMGGAATVFGAFKSLVELKVKENLLLVMPCAENAMDGNSYYPGDVYKSYSGKYVEIVNTDAEGRLVMADGLSYAQKNYNIEEIIDVATLTGASMVALGENLIAMFSNEHKAARKIFKLGEETGDRMWRLPIYDEHRTQLKSKTADLRHHHGTRYGGCIVAAAFLENFIEEGITWTHLDIAGAAYTKSNPKHYIGNMATGRGVRVLVEYFKN